MNRKQPPAGIILLVVLSSLTFFSVLLAAYLVFSNQSRQASFAISARNIHRPDVNGIIDDALMTLIRGTSVPTNPFYGEDLLSDYYGREDGYDLTIGTVGATTNGFLKFTVTGLPGTAYDDLYAGRVVTFTDGSLVNRSYRVLRSLGAELVIDLGDDATPTGITTARMNGAPRSSPGLGFNLTNSFSDEKTSTHAPTGGDTSFTGFGLPVALQPNHGPAIFDKSALANSTKFRDFDEPYDAADFNNWFLSYRHSDGTVIPSFHRPSVVNYILNEVAPWNSPTTTQQKQLLASLSRATFRPLPINKTFMADGKDRNAQFTGGNASFALRVPMEIDTAAKLNQLALVLTGTNGTTGANPEAYDVDNDADGIRDSIWVDLGLPLITAPDGKLLRPLVAPMIEDLSGRLNVNAHHNVTLTANIAGVASPNAEWAGTRNVFGSGANNRRTYRGSGFGPAEIAIPIPALGTVIEQRYRDAQTFSAFPRWSPGGAGNNDDASDIILNGSRPQQHSFNVGYGLTTDPFGRGGMAINRAGGLLIAVAGSTVRVDDTATTNLNEQVDESINDPYEFDPTGRLSNDAALDFDELEGILRAYYFDGENLPSTLTSPLSGLGNYATVARQLTTSSMSDTSPPPFTLTSGMTTPASVYGSLADWMTTKGVPATSIKALIAPELRKGNRIDINRPFGNGVDNSSPANGTIDEPTETETLAFDVAAGSPSSVPAGYNSAAPDYNLDDPLTASARQLLARHLYVLMMALADGKDFPTVNTTINADNYKARRIAQWAVNVVDYSDPDSIMTPFQYDPTPFTGGWTPSQYVFGVEQPELVLTETLAFHDVRVRDTDKNIGAEKKIDDATDPDDDTDQVRLPQGSLFVELMCPRAASSNPVLSTNDHRTKAAYPAELYDLTGVTPQLDLSKTTPTGTPVWRLAISEPHFAASTATVSEYAASGNQSNDPFQVRGNAYDSVSFQPANLDPLATSGPSPLLTLERFLVFQSSTTTANIISNGLVPAEMTATNTFFANSSGLRLSPGQFAVIAPRTITHLGSQGAVQPEKPSDQRFVQSATNGIVHFGLDTGGGSNPKMPNFNNSTNYNTALSILAQIDRPAGWPANRFQDGLVGLNVSEPLPAGGSYYPQPTAANYLSATPGVYPILDAYVDLSSAAKTALDQPVDLAVATPRLPTSTVAKGSGDEVALGTIPRYCSLFLQRLADPLSPFNATTNPYITVDWMSVDLNVFSGEDEMLNVVNSAHYARRSRQKNGQIDGDSVNALYSYETNVPRDIVSADPNDPNEPMVSVDATTPAYFAFADDGNGNSNHSVHNSLSFLNTDEPAVNPRLGALANPPFQGFSHSIGSEGGTGITGFDRNLPRIPYAKHTWLNRPFVTPYELMMVPASSPGRLFHEFSVSKAMTVTSVEPLPAPVPPAAVVTITSANHGLQTGDAVMIDGVQRIPSINGIHTITFINQNQFSLDGAPPTVPTQYVAGSGTAVKIPTVFAAAGSPAELVNFYSPFSHLLNFTHTPVNAADAINFSRVFDYVQTRPPFRGEVELLDYARVTANADVRDMFTPPFNYVMDNHRVGQINLNSIENFETWKGLMLGHLNDAESAGATGSAYENQLSFNAFLNSRRGYALDETTNDVQAATVNYDANKFDSAYPTQFAGVFTENSLSSAFPTLRTPAASAVMQRRSAEAGLLRSRGLGDMKSYTTGMSGDAPRQFVRDPSEFPQTPRWTQWLTASTTNGNFHRDRARNPAMRYQTLMRMPNLVSDNSQTFLIRMTVGFFEVDASNTANLGAEYGESTGQTQRYRAMFIVDRSIPVGFKPGQDLNARDTVVFERYYP